MKILIIEDDKRLASNLKQVLKKELFAVEIANNKEEGIIEVDVNTYDCIVLDINLPDGSGLELLTYLRKSKDKTPVIIVTARNEIKDRIDGLNMGADDYVAKPVDSSELIARIRAVIRRNNNSGSPTIEVGELIINPSKHLVTIKSNLIELTAKEFAVLEYLARHSEQVLTRTMIMEHVWGNDFDSFSNVIDVYIRNLRRKFEQYTDLILIKTIRGKGYVLSSYEK